MSNHSIRVIAPPAGPAPLWVREKWVGLELPSHSARPIEQYVVYSFERSTPWRSLWWRLTGKGRYEAGYVVDVDDALAVLQIRHPEAAAWWRENVPQMIGGQFLFAAASSQPSSRD